MILRPESKTFLRKALLCLGFFLVFVLSARSQNLSLADSLDLVHREGTFEEEDHLEILEKLSGEHPDPEKAIMYSDEMIQRAKAQNLPEKEYSGYLNKGNALRVKGDLSEALQYYFLATENAVERNDQEDLGMANATVADVYSIMGNFKSAIGYYKKAILLLRQTTDSITLGAALSNIGDAYIMMKKPDSALVYLHESGEIFKDKNYEIGIGYNLGELGMVYALQGNSQKASDHIKRAIEILRGYGDVSGISGYLKYMSEIYMERGDYESAVSYGSQSRELAKEYKLKEQARDANLLLSEIYDKKGDTKRSYKYFKEHIAYKDSVSNISAVQEMANIRTDFEVSQKQLEITQKEYEVELLNEQKRTQQIISIATGIALFLIILMSIGIFRRYRFINRTNKIIEEEKLRSDKLLMNILPEETAQELKDSGRVKAKSFDSVSVMFTDFQGFTNSSRDLSPESLVKSVDFYFSEFDKIIKKHGIEKIKTIGDSYMCADGLPFPSADHPVKVVAAAFEILEFVEKAKNSKESNQSHITHFDIRIGINTGPVVAGVVGTTKFAYDIWGDTVNVASRMESNSKPGRINVSEYTYELIKDHYVCKYRGVVDVKNHGPMKMYYVNEVKS